MFKMLVLTCVTALIVAAVAYAIFLVIKGGYQVLSGQEDERRQIEHDKTELLLLMNAVKEKRNEY